jgi:hypothetical protein
MWSKQVSTDPVFVAADNPKSIARFRELLPGRTVVAGDRFLDGPSFRKTSLADAVVDMWVASYSSWFKGTYASSFSALIEALRLARKAGRPGVLTQMAGDSARPWTRENGGK